MSTDIVGSQMSPFASDALKEDKRGYGQNGFGGASSDLPGQNTTSGFAASKGALTLDAAQADRKKFEERKVNDASPPLSFGMDSRSPRNK